MELERKKRFTLAILLALSLVFSGILFYMYRSLKHDCSIDKSVLTTEKSMLKQSNNELAAEKRALCDENFEQKEKIERMMETFKPEKKFTKGIYKFSIMKGTETVSTMQFQLK
ncbi:MAG TPA: hypothetical protein PK252_02345 [Bacteroidales bacterium]|nr:hypothetical protein [Bacteroidales bacterium]